MELSQLTYSLVFEAGALRIRTRKALYKEEKKKEEKFN